MADLSTEAPVRPLDLLFREGALGSLTDGQLLERFVASGSAAGAAFDVLMARHGPMVLGVCRRILPRRPRGRRRVPGHVPGPGAAGRAKSGERESLGPWLHGVVRRAALRAGQRPGSAKGTGSPAPRFTTTQPSASSMTMTSGSCACTTPKSTGYRRSTGRSYSATFRVERSARPRAARLARRHRGRPPGPCP